MESSSIIGSSGSSNNKKRRLSPAPDALPAPILSAMTQALISTGGFPSILSILQSTGAIPSVEQITTSSRKHTQEVPPIVHLSKTDSAPQNKIDGFFTLRGGLRGYRMTRSSHGCSSPQNYYYEVWIQSRPTSKEVQDGLPPNARLAPKLRDVLQKSAPTDVVGGHARIGWSMRTADLQAPVGYDKWSYGYRDIFGSKVHNGERVDDWGSEPFGVNDIVGCWIDLERKEIRFARNGKLQGHFVLSRGKKEGGVAFEKILEGTYYPAISLYLGGTVRVNFGPYFVYPPRGRNGGKAVAVSDVCPKPIEASRVLDALKKSMPKKIDDGIQRAFVSALEVESEIRKESYEKHMQQILEDVRAERQKRGMSVADLEKDKPPAPGATPAPKG